VARRPSRGYAARLVPAYQPPMLRMMQYVSFATSGSVLHSWTACLQSASADMPAVPLAQTFPRNSRGSTPAEMAPGLPFAAATHSATDAQARTAGYRSDTVSVMTSTAAAAKAELQAAVTVVDGLASDVEVEAVVDDGVLEAEGVLAVDAGLEQAASSSTPTSIGALRILIPSSPRPAIRAGERRRRRSMGD
jgi:hypothetical protein